MIKRRLGWGLFVLFSLLVVSTVFGVVWVLERTILADAPLETLKHVYIARGASASFLVMALAGLFFETRHRLTEAKLRKFSRAVEQSPASIIIADNLGNIEYVNPRFTQLTGYSREEVIGKNPRILKSGQTPPDVYKRLWETIAAGQDWKGEVLNKKKNGEIYWEALSVSAITNERGKIGHFVGVLEDITERKRIERLKDEFVGTVTHELRTPLSLIKWSIENLKDGLAGPLRKDQRDLIEAMHRNCARLERVAGEVLDLSRLESGKAVINFQELHVPALLEEALQHFREEARKRKILLEGDFPPELPRLYADSDLILQLINNLLENAVRFTRTKVILRARDEGALLHLTVADDGPGIPEERLDRLFSKFEQVMRPAGVKGYKGSGLGLAISKEIVQQHDGQIWAESVPGQGAEFHCTLPLRQQERMKEVV